MNNSPLMTDFTKKLLSRYNATPDEWDEYNSICELSEMEIFNSYVKHASEKLECLEEHIELHVINVPACVIYPTSPSILGVSVIVCVDIDNMDALLYTSPSKWEYYKDARKALRLLSYTNASDLRYVINMLVDHLKNTANNYNELSVSEFKAIDSVIEIAQKFLFVECLKRSEKFYNENKHEFSN